MLKIEQYDKQQISNTIRGFLIYSIGDLIAQLIIGEVNISRTIGLALIGSTLYAFEIPFWFRIIENSRFRFTSLSKTKHFFFRKAEDSDEYRFSPAGKIGMAVSYFNPIWIARHMFFIQFFTFVGNGGDFQVWNIFTDMIPLANKSFFSNLLFIILGNHIIQNKINLKYRFIGSAILSAILAMYYALSIVIFQ